jgi:hypothetical protein
MPRDSSGKYLKLANEERLNIETYRSIFERECGIHDYAYSQANTLEKRISLTEEIINFLVSQLQVVESMYPVSPFQNIINIRNIK